MTAGFGKTYVSAIMMYFVFAFWAVLTLSILCLMEGLSAFLHTLRKFISIYTYALWSRNMLRCLARCPNVCSQSCVNYR